MVTPIVMPVCRAADGFEVLIESIREALGNALESQRSLTNAIFAATGKRLRDLPLREGVAG